MATTETHDARVQQMLQQILARMDAQGRKLDDIASSLAVTTSRLLGAAADSTPISTATNKISAVANAAPSADATLTDQAPTRCSTGCPDHNIDMPLSDCTTAVAPTSSSTIATREIGNTFDTDVNFVTPTKCSASCSDHDDGKLMATTSVVKDLSHVEAAPHVTNFIAVKPRCLGVNSFGRIICKASTRRQVRGGRSFRKASTSRQVRRPLSTVRVQQLAARQVFDEIPREAKELPAWEEGYYTSTRQWQTMILGSDHVVFVELPQDNKPRERLSQEHLKAWLQPVATTSSTTMGVKQCTAPMSKWCMHGPEWLAWSCGAHAAAASVIESTLKLGSDQDTRCIDDNGWLFPCEICVVQPVFKEMPPWESSLSPWNSVVEVARFVFDKVLAWSREGFSPGGAVITSKKTTLLVHGAGVTLFSLFITRPWDPGVFHSVYHLVHSETRIDQVIRTKNKVRQWDPEFLDKAIMLPVHITLSTSSCTQGTFQKLVMPAPSAPIQRPQHTGKGLLCCCPQASCERLQFWALSSMPSNWISKTDYATGCSRQSFFQLVRQSRELLEPILQTIPATDWK